MNLLHVISESENFYYCENFIALAGRLGPKMLEINIKLNKARF